AGRGRLRVFLPATPGDWIEHAIDAPPAGPLRLKIRFRAGPDSGLAQLSVNDTPTGPAHDLHSPSPTYQEIDYGDIAMPADAPLRLRLTAAAPGAGGGLRIRIDAFKLLTPLQAWREQHFGSAAPDGDAADDADPDRDGLPNLA